MILLSFFSPASSIEDTNKCQTGFEDIFEEDGKCGHGDHAGNNRENRKPQ